MSNDIYIGMGEELGPLMQSIPNDRTVLLQRRMECKFTRFLFFNYHLFKAFYILGMDLLSHYLSAVLQNAFQHPCYTDEETWRC